MNFTLNNISDDFFELKITGSGNQIKSTIKTLMGSVNMIFYESKGSTQRKVTTNQSELQFMTADLKRSFEKLESDSTRAKDEPADDEKSGTENSLQPKKTLSERSKVGKEVDALKRLHKDIHGF